MMMMMMMMTTAVVVVVMMVITTTMMAVVDDDDDDDHDGGGDAGDGDGDGDKNREDGKSRIGMMHTRTVARKRNMTATVSVLIGDDEKWSSALPSGEIRDSVNLIEKGSLHACHCLRNFCLL